MHAKGFRFRLAASLVVGLTLAGCTPSEQPTQSPSPSASPHVFTVLTAGTLTTADPAVAVTDADSMLVGSIYQRLMVVLPDTGELKPDAATDCLFTSKLVYECTLPDLKFHNGGVLDSNDVKFSIQRALRLDNPDTSIGMLSALQRIETPDDHTVRFVLSWPDNQFGYALAGQAASIVNSERFDPDTELSLDAVPVGSGPYQVVELGKSGGTFKRFEDYVGAKSRLEKEIKFSVVADSVAAESAINDGTVEAVWRSLDDAAQERLDNEIDGNPDHTTAEGFTRAVLPGMRVTELVWNPKSSLRNDTKLRTGIARALQGDRTLASIVPVGVEDYAESFPLGGRVKLPKLSGARIHLTLGYQTSTPGGADLANLLRGRIEELDGVSVRLVHSGEADLWLTDAPAWVNNANGWLQRYVDHPLSTSKQKLKVLEKRARTTSGDDRTAALTELQLQAAADRTVLPVSQRDGILYLGPGVKLIGSPFGSGQILGFWGFTNG